MQKINDDEKFVLLSFLVDSKFVKILIDLIFCRILRFMALETILKNICSFLEVLQNARSETVVKWDQQSVENAFKWAAYCEQVRCIYLSQIIQIALHVEFYYFDVLGRWMV